MGRRGKTAQGGPGALNDNHLQGRQPAAPPEGAVFTPVGWLCSYESVGQIWCLQ